MRSVEKHVGLKTVWDLFFCHEHQAILFFLLLLLCVFFTDMKFMGIVRNDKRFQLYIHGAQGRKRALKTYANSEGPDGTHLCSLSWTSSVRRHKLQYPLIL